MYNCVNCANSKLILCEKRESISYIIMWIACVQKMTEISKTKSKRKVLNYAYKLSGNLNENLTRRENLARN